MNKKFPFLSAVLTGALLLGAFPVGANALSPTFQDVPADHWAYPYIEQAYGEGAVNGRYFDGTTRLYAPDGQLSLAEWLAMCTRTYWPDEVAQQPAGEAWYSANLAVAENHGLLDGLETVNVTAPLSRYDMAAVTQHAALAAGARTPRENELVSAAMYTGDWDEIPMRYQETTAFVVAAGIISGVDRHGTFAGDGTFTRAQAATVYCRLKHVVEQGTANEVTLRGGQLNPADLSAAQDYRDAPCIVVHDNVPYFSEAALTTQSFEIYGDLDDLGRCTGAFANIGTDLMPTEERGPIGMIRPSGWHTVTYGCISDRYLYNRCHLIGYQLSGENANEHNLITGTRHLNVESMLPFENIVADYVRETGNHVLYRVTPVFRGDNLLADGVLMEAYSVEDFGASICYCVFAYNVQPGISIEYQTGDSFEIGSETHPDSELVPDSTPSVEPVPIPRPEPGYPDQGSDIPADIPGGRDYVLNTNTKKFHDPGCSQVQRISVQNRHDYTGTAEYLIQQDYSPCKICNPR